MDTYERYSKKSNAREQASWNRPVVQIRLSARNFSSSTCSTCHTRSVSALPRVRETSLIKAIRVQGWFRNI